ncbi:MAG TPA: DUF3365 domain-containing protein [Polyangiaceae bacterium]
MTYPYIRSCATLVLGSVLLAACKEGEAAAGGVSPQKMADALHAVMSADRTVYTREVVNRLQNNEKVIKATEHWKDEKTLPLPAQMFRMGAEMVAEKNSGFSYALLSMWPVNQQNKPKTEVEKRGLKFVAENVGKNHYEEEELAGKKYFTAIYADVAVAPACVTCHNDHKDSPRRDFKQGDVMGGVVVRIPLDT